MRVDKQQIVEMLRARSDHALADRLNVDLPPEVDPTDYPELFQTLDLDLDAGDAARHSDAGQHESTHGLPTTG